MPTIKDIRARVLEIMDNAYGPAVAPTKATDLQIAAKFFVRQKDAKKIMECCKKHNLKVSFRAAGEDTLTRINGNNPCKGHTILDKSIKKKGVNWTYIGNEAELQALKGFVGYGQVAAGATTKTLQGVWAFIGGKEVKVSLETVKNSPQGSFFTGDYDMHDLLGATGRIPATTPEEHSAIEYLNNAMLDESEKTRKTNVTNTSKDKRNFESPYALIRHGAQTSYMSFLLSDEGKTDLTKALASNPATKLPHQDQVMNIDPNIVMFDQKGDAYILDSINKIYSYYKLNVLTDQIPFYYFFADLQSKFPEIKEELEGYAKILNGFLKNYIK